ncbi:MAG: HEAT repeat domain-containing protein, partial [Anaerolineae bacterium]|nr:HEAT repeat domain-containing protein [Anaerolineae bacterium]
MGSKEKTLRLLRWMLSVLLVIAGLSATWAWGQVAQLAEPEIGTGKAEAPALHAAWQPAGRDHKILFRSVDEGQSWQPLALPDDAAPTAWIATEGGQLAVALENETVVRSQDAGDTWNLVVEDLPVLSLARGRHEDMYLGTDGQGLYRLASNGVLAPVAGLPSVLEAAPLRHLGTAASGRLIAATGNTVFYSDDGGQTWLASAPVEGGISALVVADAQQFYVGTETMGVYKTADAGRTWHWVSEGLGLAAGQMVKITALRMDPEAANVLYATVDHVVGSTHLHASAAGAFTTLDGGASWQPLAGPAFPEAEPASSLVIVPGKPLNVQAVTDTGLQGYKPDLVAALDSLQGDDATDRAAAARLLGLARVQDAQVAEALLMALSDPDPGVSLAASRALGNIGGPDTVGALMVALDHPSEQVHLGAARALGMMRAEAAVEPLSNMFLSGEGLAVTVAAEALGRIGTPTALDALVEPLADLTMTSQRHAALSALETIGEPAVGRLIPMLGSPSGHIRRNAAEAL